MHASLVKLGLLSASVAACVAVTYGVAGLALQRPNLLPLDAVAASALSPDYSADDYSLAPRPPLDPEIIEAAIVDRAPAGQPRPQFVVAPTPTTAPAPVAAPTLPRLIPTATPVDTPEPAPTDTREPEPTGTPVVVPTDTPEPTPTNQPTSIATVICGVPKGGLGSGIGGCKATRTPTQTATRTPTPEPTETPEPVDTPTPEDG